MLNFSTHYKLGVPEGEIKEICERQVYHRIDH